MSDRLSGLMLGFFIGFVLLCALLDLTGRSPRNISRDAYRAGQIDALSGKVKYELRENPDGTRTWEEVRGEQ